MQVEALILDFDDTLVRMTADRWSVFENALRGFGADNQTLAAMNRLKGADFGSLVGAAAPQARLADFLKVYCGMLSRERLQICPGVPKLLEWARATSVTTVVLSSSSRVLVERDLELAGIVDHFDAVFGFEDIPAPKPNKVAVATVLESSVFSDCTAEHSFMIGDSLADAAAAQGQVPFIGVLSGTTTQEEFRAAGVMDTVNSLTDLPFLP